MVRSDAFRRSDPPARLPVLISVPHAGTAYAPGLLAAMRISPTVAGMLEDPLVDRLVERGIAAGAAAIVATAPRAEIDLNRALGDFDPGMVSPGSDRPLTRRAAAGLGLIPSRLAGHGAIWRRALPAGEVERRIAAIYRPYHEAVAASLLQLRDRFGFAVLLDCHSMPPRPAPAAAIVLGDRGGSSCGEWLTWAAETACAAHGLHVARNDPYAGGEIVARHGRPDYDIHALQIEIDRGLYLAPDLRSPGSGFARIAAFIAAVVNGATAGPALEAIAAE